MEDTEKIIYIEYACPICGKSVSLHILMEDLQKIIDGKAETIKCEAYKIL